LQELVEIDARDCQFRYDPGLESCWVGVGYASERCPIVPSIAPPRVDSGRQRDWNPLAADSMAAAGSSYLGAPDGVLKHLLDPDQQPGAAEVAVHDELVKQVLGEEFPCVGARSAFNRRVYRFGRYSVMTRLRLVCWLSLILRVIAAGLHGTPSGTFNAGRPNA
jgi:hypothetical protein